MMDTVYISILIGLYVVTYLVVMALHQLRGVE
jgi:hypothetical protein